MNKKIIAILLVFTLVITCFVACQKKKYETTNVNGMDLLLYTDENGNTVINEDNQIIAVVTDSDGEIITYESGEEQTHYVQISGSFVNNGYIQEKNYKLAIPEGWEGTTNSKIIKKDTDGKCYIKFGMIKQADENEGLHTYLETIDTQNSQLIEGLKEKGYTLTVEKENAAISTYTSYHYTYKIVDGEGKVVHYAENIYFIVAKTIYSINYACEDGVGYDESFNFESYVKNGFTFKDR